MEPFGSRTVLVTGASRGIGRQIALAYARAGFDVAFTARTAVEGQGRVGPRVGSGDAVAVPGSLETTARDVAALGVRALPVPMDLLDEGSVRDAVATVHHRWGPVDVLVNSAITHVAGEHDRLLDLDPAVAASTMPATSCRSWCWSRPCCPGWSPPGRGVVVNLCSGSATTDPPAAPGEGGGGLAYAASKAAFGRIAGAINAEYRQAGVRAFNLDPGFVITEAGLARGGTATVADAGFEPTPAEHAGAAVVWLATAADSDRFLGRVVWTPRLVADLGLTGP
jgi:NAD(P)-dependent dehydrogenase (short-subunit alcohol dehydrogenase family)